jgi:hypothetical protein
MMCGASLHMLMTGIYHGFMIEDFEGFCTNEAVDIHDRRGEFVASNLR